MDRKALVDQAETAVFRVHIKRARPRVEAPRKLVFPLRFGLFALARLQGVFCGDHLQSLNDILVTVRDLFQGKGPHEKMGEKLETPVEIDDPGLARFQFERVAFEDVGRQIEGLARLCLRFAQDDKIIGIAHHPQARHGKGIVQSVEPQIAKQR